MPNTMNVKKSSNDTVIITCSTENKAQENIALYVWLGLFIAGAAFTFYELVKYNGQRGYLIIHTVFFFVLFFVTMMKRKCRNSYLLQIDSDGFHEKSLSFTQKNFSWNEVLYVNYFSDLIIPKVNFRSKYSVLVISKVKMDETQRKEFIKSANRMAGIERAKSKDDIIIKTNRSQARRIYEMIYKCAEMYADVSAFSKKIGTEENEM